MELILALTAMVITYHLGKFNQIKKQRAIETQWKKDCETGTPIGTQLAREMGIEL